jgi:hypothetical protein
MRTGAADRLGHQFRHRRPHGAGTPQRRYSKLAYSAGVLSGGTIALATKDGTGRARSTGTVRVG